jgi:hypothetical protein
MRYQLLMTHKLGDARGMTSKCVSEGERKKHLYQRFMVVVGQGGRSVVHSPVSISGDGLAHRCMSAWSPFNEEKKSLKQRIKKKLNFSSHQLLLSRFIMKTGLSSSTDTHIAFHTLISSSL